MSGNAIVLGTRSGDLSDWLALTAEAERIRARDPGANVRYWRRSYGPAVFRGNPNVSGSALFASRLTGATGEPQARLYVSEAERDWAKRFVSEHTLPGNERKPIVILHPWGSGWKTEAPVAPVEWWDGLVAGLKDRYRFWEIGPIGSGAVVGCEYYYWSDLKARDCRRVFALIEQARGYVGTDSSAARIAASFSKPVQLVSQAEVERFEKDSGWIESALGRLPRA